MTTSTGIVSPVGIAHVRLTVTDIARSKPFYVQLFGAEPAFDFSDETDPAVREDPKRLYGGCVFALGDQILGLRPVADAGDSFRSTRVGLDHVSLLLRSVDELRDAVERLDAAGVQHGEFTVLDGFGQAIVSVQDPDDINLELSAAIEQS